MSEIDYQAIAEGLQLELETARLEILRMRFGGRSLKFNSKVIQAFIRENYLTIAAVVLVLTALPSTLSTTVEFLNAVKSLFKKSED